MSYLVLSTDKVPQLDAGWNSPTWQAARTMKLENVRPESSDHHPDTALKLLYDRENLYGLFRVKDKYVRCVQNGYHDSVCRDSCVEFFVQPKSDEGYFNFEFNCGGNLHVSYIVDPTRTPAGFRKSTPLPKEDVALVPRYHSLPETIAVEISADTEWFLGFSLPYPLFEKYVGILGEIRGQQWRANAYKCADKTSHPHWLSWQPVHKLNFHLPECFGTIEFQN